MNQYKMTGEEILEKLNAAGVSGYELKYEGQMFDEVFGKSKVVEDEGGHEGDGEYVCVTRHFIDHDIYVKDEGFYTSYGEGTTWDGELFLVRPVEKMVTYYE